MSIVPHAKLQLNKRSLKLSGQTYAVQQKKLERVLAEQLEDLELKENAIAADRTREQVLADLVAHQEVVIGLLEHQQDWLATLLQYEQAKEPREQHQPGTATTGGNPDSAGLPGTIQTFAIKAEHDDSGDSWGSQLLGAAPMPPAVGAAAAATKAEAGVAEPASQQQLDAAGGMSYVAGLLANATPAQLRRVMQMKAEDWQQYKHDHFMRLVALLELVNRPSCLQELDEDDQLEQQQQQQQQQQLVAGSRSASGSRGSRASGATAAAAAPAGQHSPAAPAAAPRGSGLEAFGIPQRFCDAVDEGITLSFLALFFNHLSITQASTNADLPQQAAPAGIWMRVVKKLDLTDQQLLQLRIASEEFTRLNRSCSLEAEALMGRANRPSLLLAAEASIQAAAASSSLASGSSGSGGSGSNAQPASSSGGPAGSNASGSSSATPAAFSSGTATNIKSEATTPGAPAAAETYSAAAAASAAEQEAAAAAADGDEDDDGQLDGLLQRHLRLRFLYMIMIGMFVFNTLSRVQIAQMTVTCYPFYPMLTAVAEAAATLHKQRQQEEEKRIRARRRQRLFNEDPEEQQPAEKGDEDDEEGDDSRSSAYARQQLRQHQQQRSRLLQLQQAFWQQQVQHGLLPMQP